MVPNNMCRCKRIFKDNVVIYEDVFIRMSETLQKTLPVEHLQEKSETRLQLSGYWLERTYVECLHRDASNNMSNMREVF